MKQKNLPLCRQNDLFSEFSEQTGACFGRKESACGGTGERHSITALPLHFTNTIVLADFTGRFYRHILLAHFTGRFLPAHF
jgi:hypothetical protein